MKKIFLLFSVLFISFSFGQTKKKNPSSVEENIPIVKDSNYETVITKHSENSVQTVVYEENTIYNLSEVEVKPDFPGGMQNFYALAANNYQMPDEEGLRGKIVVTFVVEKDGSLSDIKAIRDIGFGTGKEAIRVIKKMAKWIPAEINGKKVRCSFTLPITLPFPKQF